MSVQQLQVNEAGKSGPGVLPQIRSLARHRDLGSTSWLSAKLALVSAARTLASSAEEDSPPVNLGRVLPLRRIGQPRVSKLAEPTEALLVPVTQGFDLRVRLGIPPLRRRATIAHEIGHTFFYDTATSPPHRVFPTLQGDAAHKEEALCWAFARELLMPTRLLNAELSGIRRGASIGAILPLAEVFKVSTELATVRLLYDKQLFRRTAVVFAKGPLADAAECRTSRAYFGQAARALRTRERDLVERVRCAVEAGPPFAELSDVIVTSAELATVDWRFRESRHMWSACATVDFVTQLRLPL